MNVLGLSQQTQQTQKAKQSKGQRHFYCPLTHVNRNFLYGTQQIVEKDTKERPTQTFKIHVATFSQISELSTIKTQF